MRGLPLWLCILWFLLSSCSSQPAPERPRPRLFPRFQAGDEIALRTQIVDLEMEVEELKSNLAAAKDLLATQAKVEPPAIIKQIPVVQTYTAPVQYNCSTGNCSPRGFRLFRR